MKHSLSRCHALSSGIFLHQKYKIENVLGTGGFGITYSGIHIETGNRVAIKEYFPSSLAVRTEQEGLFSLCPFPENNTEIFLKERDRFINEAKILKELQTLESIVSIYDLFEENGTAYIVMEYIDGLPLYQYVTENGTFTFPEILSLMIPVIQDLAEIHNKGLIHRDISPDNLILGTDNQLHLIDFGAASQDNPQKNQNTVILKTGYAPPEQYIATGNIGAWTDVYSLCATIYFALTGSAPSEAMQLLEQNTLIPQIQINGLLPWQTAALEKGLSVRPADRYQDMRELYLAFVKVPQNEKTIVGSKQHPAQKLRGFFPGSYSSIGNGMAILISFTCLVILLYFSLPLLLKHENTSKEQNISVVTPVVSSATPEPSDSSITSLSEETGDTNLLTMPDLTKTSLKKAQQILKNLDASIKIHVVRIYHPKKEKGQIIAQSVAEGTTFTPKHLSSIQLTVSKGKRPIKKETSKTTASPTKKPKENSDYDVKENDDYISIPLE